MSEAKTPNPLASCCYIDAGGGLYPRVVCQWCGGIEVNTMAGGSFGHLILQSFREKHIACTTAFNKRRHKR